jgi:hypothetical protein
MDPSMPSAPGLVLPRPIRYASYLMWAGAALQAAAAGTALLTESLLPAAMFGIFSLIAITFWYWSARAARRASPGTRVSATILLTVSMIYLVKWQSGPEPLPVVIAFALEWLAGLGATALLFGKGSAAYFRRYRADRPGEQLGQG